MHLLSLNLELAVLRFGAGVRNFLSKDLLLETYVSIFNWKTNLHHVLWKTLVAFIMTCLCLHLGLISKVKGSMGNPSTSLHFLSQIPQAIRSPFSCVGWSSWDCCLAARDPSNTGTPLKYLKHNKKIQLFDLRKDCSAGNMKGWWEYWKETGSKLGEKYQNKK